MIIMKFLKIMKMIRNIISEKVARKVLVLINQILKKIQIRRIKYKNLILIMKIKLLEMIIMNLIRKKFIISLKIFPR